MAKMVHGVFLVVVEENVEEEVVCSNLEWSSKCGPDCSQGWIKGCIECCPPTKLAMAPGPDMDGELWGWLPSELFGMMLEKLPRSCQFHVKSVCKEWLTEMRSLAFFRSSALAAVSLKRSPCLVWDTVAGDHIGSRSWPRLQLLKVHVPCDTPKDNEQWLSTHVLPIKSTEGEPPRRYENYSALPPRRHQIYSAENEQANEFTSYYQIWSEGLLCIINVCEDGDPAGLAICVINPVTSTWIALPYLPLFSPSQARVILAPAEDHSSSHFRVMVKSLESCGGPDHMHPPLASEPCCGTCRLWCFNVYSSKTSAWSTTKSPQYEHPNPPHQLEDEHKAQLYNNNSHLVVDELLYVLGNDPNEMLILDAKHGTLLKHFTNLGDGGIAGPWPKNYEGKIFAHLVEHEGSIYCVAFTPCTCWIWKLLNIMDDMNDPQWTHTSSFYWSGTGGSETLSDVILFSVVSMGGRIYAAFKGSMDRFIPSGEIILSYDLQGKKWKTISRRFSNVLFVPRPKLYLPHPIPLEQDLEADNAELAVYTRTGYW